MSNPLASRSRKRRTDKLDWEELEKAPNVEGMLSYLRQPPGIGVPGRQAGMSGVTAIADIRDETAERSAGQELTGELGSTQDVHIHVPAPGTLAAKSPVAATAVNGNLEKRSGPGQQIGLNAPQLVSLSVVPEKVTESSVPQGTLEQSKKTSDNLLSSPIDVPSAIGSRLPEPVGVAADEDVLGAPLSGLEIDSALTNRRVHRCVYVQDAHTPGEQVVLSTLSRLAKHPRFGRAEVGGSYLVNVSLPQLAVHAAMHPTNVRMNVRSLIEKLAIELVEHEDRKRQTARTYRILTFKQILERRRAAGLEYVIKNRGIRFVGKGEVEKLLSTESLGSVFRARSWSLPSNALSEVGSESLGPLPSESLPTLIRREGFKNEEQTSTSSYYSPVPPKLVEGIQQFVPLFDNEATILLWNDCRARAADCTVEEVLHFTKIKAAIFKTGKIQNPPSFLLATVPKCFEGQAFNTFRERETKRRAEQQRREEEELKQARIIEEELRAEEEAYRKAEEALASLSAEEYHAFYQQTRRDYLVLVPKAESWTPEALDQSVRACMIRELQSRFLKAF